jgi:hypothetical protein
LKATGKGRAAEWRTIITGTGIAVATMTAMIADTITITGITTTTTAGIAADY